MSSPAAISAPQLKHLPFDSDIFGFRTARLDGLSRETRQTIAGQLEAARRDGVRHLSARVSAADASSIRALEQNGFELVDGLVTYGRMLTALPPCPRDVRPFTAADLEPLAQVAKTAYSYDRFHSDPAIPTAAADRLHETWFRNSCDGPAADAVLVAGGGPSPEAFITLQCRHDTGIIVLIGAARQARGAGLGGRLTDAALSWFAGRGARHVRVGTQAANVAACRLYESRGFRTEAFDYTFRRLL